MKSKKEIIKSVTYWLTHLQVELFRQLKNYMVENNLSQNDMAEKLKVTKGHISQILNGESNFTLKKLITLSLHIGKVPLIRFVNQNVFLSNEKKIEQFFQRLDNDIPLDAQDTKTPIVQFNKNFFNANAKLLSSLQNKTPPGISNFKIQPDIRKVQHTQKVTAN